MTSERTQAYGRVVRTLEDVGPTKLHDGEQERIRDAADTLIFAASLRRGPRAPSRTSRRSTEQLVESGRWTEERAAELGARPHGLRAGRARRLRTARAAGSRRPWRTPSSSARGPTGSSPPTCSPTPAGRSSSSRPSPSRAAPCAARQLTLPGFTHDRFSAFYPLGDRLAAPAPAAASRSTGCAGARAPVIVADPLRDGTRRAPLAATSRRRAPSRRRRRARATAPRGASSCDLVGRASARASWRALLDPFPPVRERRAPAAARSAGRARARVRPLRPALRAPLRAASASAATRAGRLLAGNALHPDIGPETPGSALFAMVLVGLGQRARLAGARGRRGRG